MERADTVKQVEGPGGGVLYNGGGAGTSKERGHRGEVLLAHRHPADEGRKLVLASLNFALQSGQQQQNYFSTDIHGSSCSAFQSDLHWAL